VLPAFDHGRAQNDAGPPAFPAGSPVRRVHRPLCGARRREPPRAACAWRRGRR